MDQELLFEVRDGISHVTLNRPQARNALTFSMYEGLARHTQEIADDPAIKALVITGAGDKAFAAGTDIAQFLDFKDGKDGIAYEEKLSRIMGTMERCPKPLIAAIHGACTGGGAAIAALCDLRIASRSARIGFPIARTLGNCVSTDGISRVAALVGPARVTEMIFTGKLVEAEAALAIGLVSEVLDDQAALLARAHELALTVGSHAPLTLRATKEQLRRLRMATVALANSDDIVEICFGSDDFRNAVRAFVERRPPQWSGR